MMAIILQAGVIEWRLALLTSITRSMVTVTLIPCREAWYVALTMVDLVSLVLFGWAKLESSSRY